MLTGFRREECQHNKENAVRIVLSLTANHVGLGPVRSVLVGLAGAGAGPHPHPAGGAEDDVC